MTYAGDLRLYRRRTDSFVGKSTSARAGALFQLLQTTGEELGFLRVLDVAASEHAAEEDAGGFKLVHVLQDEHFHLPRPQRNIGRARVTIDGGGVASGEWKIVQAVLRYQRRVRHRRPAPVWIGEELSINEFQR